MEKISPAIIIETTPPKFQPINSMASTNGQVRILGCDEYKGAALCLAQAFIEDDVARYAVDTPDRENWSAKAKWDLHLCILEYITYGHCLKGLVTTVGPDYGCVALWMPPGQNMDSFCTLLRSGMWRLHYKLSAEGRTRFFTEFLPLLHETKHEVMGARDDDSWYLVYIGTKPEARGKGYARTLIEYTTKQADAQNRACYLESSNAINPIIYAKLGFSITKQIFLTRAAEPVQLDVMVREPHAKTGSTIVKVVGL